MVTMAAPKWTEAEDTMLRDMTAKGYSGGRIRQRMPERSRNAIIGRQHRLGLKGGPKGGPKPRANTPSAMPLKPPRDHRDYATINVSELRRLRAEMEAAPKQEPKQSPEGAPVPLMIPLLDLTDHMCRWPVNSPERGGDFLFCAHEKERGSYCSFHAALAFAGRPVSRATRPLRRAA
jgi:GcrA cell cycle regulator